MIAIINNRPGRTDLCGLLTLEAGENLLDTKEKVDAWEKVKDIPDIKSKLELSKRFPGGELRVALVATPRKRRASAPPTVTIEGLNRKKSMVAVGATENISTLLTFIDQTNDGVTKKAIKDKIKTLQDSSDENENEDSNEDEQE